MSGDDNQGQTAYPAIKSAIFRNLLLESFFWIRYNFGPDSMSRNFREVSCRNFCLEIEGQRSVKIFAKFSLHVSLVSCKSLGRTSLWGIHSCKCRCRLTGVGRTWGRTDLTGFYLLGPARVRPGPSETHSFKDFDRILSRFHRIWLKSR